jgi:glycosyltransferase involved in cell wall biosynthesis
MATVSVIMSVYNGAEFLDEAIRSILVQTYRDFEFIAIDDGSTDASLRILNHYAAGDKRIRVISRPNRGLTRTLNEAIQLAGGKYIARMDSDDVSMPRRLEQQVAFLEKNPQILLLGGAYELIDDRGRKLTTHYPPLDNDALQQRCLDGRTPICHPLAMIRRDALLRVGGYDESFLVAQDLDLWLRLGEIGHLACLPDVLLYYRMHENSISERKQSQQVANMRRAVEAAARRRGVPVSFKGEAGWRALDDRESRLKQATKYGWWAWHSGHNRTALVYGCKAIVAHPGSGEGWKLLLAAMLRRSPRARSV